MTDEEQPQFESDDIGRRFEDLRRHFDVSQERIRAEVRTLAEAVSALLAEVRRTREEVVQRIESSAQDTKAMINSLHAGLS